VDSDSHRKLYPDLILRPFARTVDLLDRRTVKQAYHSVSQTSEFVPSLRQSMDVFVRSVLIEVVTGR
jgi:hypothetical protein